MDTERTFRYRYNQRLVAGLAVMGALAAAVLCGVMQSWRPESGARFVGLVVLCVLGFGLWCDYSERRLCRKIWVRVRPSGLTVSYAEGAMVEIEWCQVASISPDVDEDDHFWGLSVSTRDGRIVDVDSRIARGEELCRAIWGTGLFVATAEAGATRWVPKLPGAPA